MPSNRISATRIDGTGPEPEIQYDRCRLTADPAVLDQAVPVAQAIPDPGARLPHVTPIIAGKRLEALQRYVRTVALPGEVQRAIVAITAAAVQAGSGAMQARVIADGPDNRRQGRVLRGAHELQN